MDRAEGVELGPGVEVGEAAAYGFNLGKLGERVELAGSRRWFLLQGRLEGTRVMSFCNRSMTGEAVCGTRRVGVCPILVDTVEEDRVSIGESLSVAVTGGNGAIAMIRRFSGGPGKALIGSIHI